MAKQRLNTDVTVDIVIAAFNEEAVLGRALDSICAQTALPRRVIVVDDGSFDRTSEIAQTHKIHNYTEATVVRQANHGVSSARNKGISLSDSDFLLFLDADDELDHLHISRLKRALSICPDAGLVFTGSIRVADQLESESEVNGDADRFWKLGKALCIKNLDDNVWIVSPEITVKLIHGNFIPVCSAAIRRTLAAAVQFDTQLSHCEDQKFFILCSEASRVVFVDEASVIIHRTGRNATNARNAKKQALASLRLTHELSQRWKLDIDHLKKRGLADKMLQDSIGLLYYSRRDGIRAYSHSLALVRGYGIKPRFSSLIKDKCIALLYSARQLFVEGS